MSSRPSQRQSLLYSEEVQVDAICARFENSWKGEESPQLEDFLADWPEPRRSVLFEELLKLELAYRQTQGQTPALEEYRSRFPDFGTVVDAVFTQTHSQTDGPPKKEDFTFLSPPQSEDEIGRLGPYRVLEILGAGGMGVVFLAEDVQLQRPVALKVMRPSLAEKPSSKERFLREARATAALKHDHIVTIYQVSEANNVPFLAMELLEGCTLDARFKDGFAPTLLQIVRLGRGIALALEAAHEIGLIHRDIKPSNVWIETHQDERIKLLDFGLARLVTDDAELTHSDMILGTPAYMAPEQVHRRTVDHRCDLFSLGCVLYQLCTGQLPFQGETSMAVMLASAEHEAPGVRSLNSRIPAELENLVMKLLQKDPSGRPSTARAVAETLEAIETSLQASMETHPVPGKTTPQKPAPVLVDTNSYAESKGGHAHGAVSGGARVLRLLLIAAGLLFVLGAGYAVFQFIYETPQGTFLVEIHDKEVEARFKNGQIRIYDDEDNLKYTLRADVRNRRLPAGQYKLKVVGADGVQLSTEKFTMKKDGRVAVQITLRPPALESDPERVVARWALSVGEWVFVQIQGQERETRLLKGESLPSAPFQVTEIYIRKNATVHDSDLARLSNLTALRMLGLDRLPLTNACLEHIARVRPLEQLYFYECDITDQGLARIAELKNLRNLHLLYLPISNAGVAHLQKLTRLEHLNIVCSTKHGQISADVVKLIAQMTNLKVLHLNAPVTDEGLGHLRSLKKLKVLSLRSSKITGKTLGKLRGLLLEHLDFRATPFAPDACQRLGDFPHLATLYVGGQDFTDAHLKSIGELSGLQKLLIENAAVTDEGLKHLHSLSKLKQLFIEATPVQQSTLDELKKALTTCDIQVRDKNPSLFRP